MATKPLASLQEVEHALAENREGRSQTLEALCRRMLAEDAGNAFAATNLSNMLGEQGRYPEAIQICEQAAAKAPGLASNHLNLAHFHLQLKNYKTALVHAREAVRLTPDAELSLVNLSSAAYHAEQYEEAIAASRKVLEKHPDHFGATTNLATALKGVGRLHEAIAAYRRALALNPAAALAHTNLLLTLLYDADTPVPEIVSAARAYARQFEEPAMAIRRPHRNVALPERRLRIGFISPDFNNHAVMYFAEPVLHRLPRQSYEIWCYLTQPVDDFITRRLDGLADRMRVLKLAEPRQSAQQIQEDEIDILIDLAGHTAKNGLEVMCYKPAPVQVTWLGYPGTTGLRAIDYRITDGVADVPGIDVQQYTEHLVRLPGCFCVYRPHVRDVGHHMDPRYQVQPTPALARGHITFGSCNNIAKISAPTVHAWSRILSAMPLAHLLIEGKDFASPASTAGLRTQFASHGIGEDRLVFVSREAARQYLTYHDIDIALDTFPLTGGTTTFDALWMGVPVLTIQGSTFRERLSASILAGGGFGDDVCQDVDAYVGRALALAADIHALDARRSRQRARMQASVLMNEPRYVSLFSQALRQMWRHWCLQQEPQGVAAGKPVPDGQDVLVPVNGRRVTLPQALAWLAQLQQDAGAHDIRPSAACATSRRDALNLASAILTICPENATARAVVQGHADRH